MLTDKYKENEILLGQNDLLKYDSEVIRMAEKDSELLNTVYKEIADNLGMDIAMDIYKMYKGQQITLDSIMLKRA